MRAKPIPDLPPNSSLRPGLPPGRIARALSITSRGKPDAPDLLRGSVALVSTMAMPGMHFGAPDSLRLTSERI
jgi:hypothetical protein